MTVIQPWQKPYDQLLRDSREHHGGEIILPEDRSKSDLSYLGGSEGTGQQNPVYHGTLNSIKFHVEIIRDHQLHVHAYSKMASALARSSILPSQKLSAVAPPLKTFAPMARLAEVGFGNVPE